MRAAAALLFLFFCGAGFSQIQRIMEFGGSIETAGNMAISASAVDTTLPQPRFYPEPEYTWGLENAVLWNSDSLRTVAGAAGADLVLYEVEASYYFAPDSVERWGYVDASKGSATFRDLPGGVEISYKLRYLASLEDGSYAFSRWSPVEKSIQDVSRPFVTLWDIKHMQRSGGINWVVGQNIENHVIASDTALGKVKEIIVTEESEEVGSIITSILIENPASLIDTTVDYIVMTPPRKRLQLILQVKDLSGQVSIPDTMVIFWWPFEGEDKDVLCFPNPFNPDINERSIIKCDVPDAAEARIYDLFGNLVRIISKAPDDYFFEWDGRNGEGDIVSNGGYVCVVKNALNKYCKIAVIR